MADANSPKGEFSFAELRSGSGSEALDPAA
jgi:hypothetical protein